MRSDDLDALEQISEGDAVSWPYTNIEDEDKDRVQTPKEVSLVFSACFHTYFQRAYIAGQRYITYGFYGDPLVEFPDRMSEASGLPKQLCEALIAAARSEAEKSLTEVSSIIMVHNADVEDDPNAEDAPNAETRETSDPDSETSDSDSEKTLTWADL